MDKNEISEIQENKIIYLSYNDDNEKTVSGYFILLKLSENFIQVKSNQNIILIPFSKIQKLKQKIETSPAHSTDVETDPVDENYDKGGTGK